MFNFAEHGSNTTPAQLPTSTQRLSTLSVLDNVLHYVLATRYVPCSQGAILFPRRRADGKARASADCDRRGGASCDGATAARLHIAKFAD